jgi:hypothetical protein
MDTINTELASFKSAHAPIESAECVVRIPKPDWDYLRELDAIVWDMQNLATLMKDTSEYELGICETDYTQEQYETACAGFSLLYAKLKWLVEGNNA